MSCFLALLAALRESFFRIEASYPFGELGEPRADVIDRSCEIAHGRGGVHEAEIESAGVVVAGNAVAAWREDVEGVRGRNRGEREYASVVVDEAQR